MDSHLTPGSIGAHGFRMSGIGFTSSEFDDAGFVVALTVTLPESHVRSQEQAPDPQRWLAENLPPDEYSWNNVPRHPLLAYDYAIVRLLSPESACRFLDAFPVLLPDGSANPVFCHRRNT